MKTELEQLRKEFNDKIDSLLNKPQFEVGKWYTNRRTDTPYFFNYNGHKSFGWNNSGSWRNDMNPMWSNIYFPATPEEVQDALVKEAIKRGYDNNEFTCLTQPQVDLKNQNNKFFYNKEDRLIYGTKYNGNTCYKQGKWAEIIKDDEIKIGGYEVKFFDIYNGGISSVQKMSTTIDGNEFTKEFWQAAKIISEHPKAKIMVGCSKQLDVSLDSINAILNRL